MFCMMCNKEFPKDCTCEDRDERMKAISEVVVYKKCKKCDLHYSLCFCRDPEWISSDEDVVKIRTVKPVKGTDTVQ